MEHGKVKSFDEAKGQGWIIPTDGPKEVFVQQSNLGDIKTLPVDAMVTYESRTNDKGIEAFNVSLTK